MSESKNIFGDMKPEVRKKIVLSVILIAFIVFGTSYYYSKEGIKEQTSQENERFMNLEVDGELFEEDINQTLQESNRASKERDTAINTRLSSQSRAIQNTQESLKLLLEGIKTQQENTKNISVDKLGITYPPPPGGYTISEANIAEIETNELEVEAVTFIGGITHKKIEQSLINSEIKKKGKRIYLPPSFMKATLLTGLDASTAEGANEHPQPLMIRVQEPAVLPNTLKADLQGCFVIAHGFGALNKERIETRLVSLNCLSKDGTAIIDTAVKGYVTDSDGKSGLKGLVVSKQGAHLARVFAAGVFGGIGKIAEQSGRTVSVGPLTTTTQITPSSTMTAGIGAGIADSSKDLRKFFLNMAKQASPVISVGPAKKLTVVITEGVWLDIRDNMNE